MPNTNIKTEIDRIVQYRDLSFDAVAAKGVTVPSGSTIDDLPDLIMAIQSGSGSAISIVDTTDENGGTIRTITGVSLAGDTVAPDKLLQGYTAHNSLGEAITGTYVPSGSGVIVEPNKTVTPSKSQQVVTPSTGYDALAQVTVAAIPAPYQDVTGVTASAGDVVSGKSIVDSTGATVNGTLVINKYYTGSSNPSSSLGNNGDLYLKV